MQRMLSIICALILTLMLPAAWMVSRGLPADTGSYIAEKYAGWSGVIQAWIFSEWKAGGSFITWLNRCAAEFEKAHKGVYIEFTPVSRDAMRTIGTSGMRAPELVFFSPGILEYGFAEMTSPAVREELQGYAALPVAMGGTIWAVNRELAETVPQDIIVPAGFEDEAAALMSGDAQEEAAPVEPGLDLGLPVSAGVNMEELLDRFIDGGVACMPVTQAEIARLARLRDAGRGPDWECMPAGAYAWTDQLLLAGVTDEGERFDLAREFALGLLEDENQAALADIGAFSVTGRMVHAGHSAWAQLDALLNSRPLMTPSAISEHLNPNG